jgi:phenylacetate-CoA ligase
MAFIPTIEQKTLSEQADFQLQKLKETLDYIKGNAPFYTRKLSGYETAIGNISALSDLSKLPTTSKEDLQQYNWDFLCVPRQNVAEYMSTSGTLGRPVVIALTANDLDRLAYNEYLSFQLMEAGADDVFQLMLTLDRQFMAGTAYYNGLRKMGAAVIRSGPGLPVLQLETMQQFDVTGLVAVPSFLSKMLDIAGISVLENLKVKKILAIGESLRDEHLQPNALAQKIQAKWDVQLYGTYASTEMQTAFTECSAAQGGHLHPELIIVEILDDDGNVMSPGEAGEVTITTLGIEGMPLLRYRTGDICKVYTEPCSCGRTTMRLGPVLGRKKQMIKFKGTSIYPPQLFEVLNALDAVYDYVVELQSDNQLQDVLNLHIHTKMEEGDCSEQIKPVFQHKWRVTPNIIYASVAELQHMQFPNNSRKPMRFIDHRNSILTK